MADLTQVMPDLERTYSTVFAEKAKEVYRNLWDNTPVKTGFTRSRWNARELTPGTVRISSDAPALEFLNRGSSTQAPAGFIEKSIEQALRDNNFSLDASPEEEEFELIEGYVSDDKNAKPPIAARI